MNVKVFTAIPTGYSGQLIEVEGTTNKGLPSFNLVGMGDKTILESRERVRSAIMNSDFSFPKHKITINLAPADLIKKWLFSRFAYRYQYSNSRQTTS